jgi:hypothetical protein
VNSFISVSGTLSTQIGLALSDWLKSVLQHVQSWIAAEDISKGSQWRSVLSQSLASTDCGIIVLCPDNLQKPWLMYEAGVIAALTKMQRVATLLIDVQPQDVEAPLDQFQHTLFDRPDVLKLVHDINTWTGDRLTASKVEEVFAMWWPVLETKVSECKQACPVNAPLPHRDASDIMGEILELTRDVHRRTCSPRAEDRIRAFQRELKGASSSSSGLLDGLLADGRTAVESVSILMRPTGPTGPTAPIEIGVTGPTGTRQLSTTTFHLAPAAAGEMPNRGPSGAS